MSRLHPNSREIRASRYPNRYEVRQGRRVVAAYREEDLPSALRIAKVFSDAPHNIHEGRAYTVVDMWTPTTTLGFPPAREEGRESAVELDGAVVDHFVGW